MISLFFITLSFALDLDFGKKSYEFKTLENGLEVAQCKKDCMAQTLRTFVSKELKGGKNPATQACGDGRVLLMTDKKKNQHSVCLFNDGSMVTSDSVYALTKKLN